MRHPMEKKKKQGRQPKRLSEIWKMWLGRIGRESTDREHHLNIWERVIPLGT